MIKRTQLITKRATVRVIREEPTRLGLPLAVTDFHATNTRTRTPKLDAALDYLEQVVVVLQQRLQATALLLELEEVVARHQRHEFRKRSRSTDVPRVVVRELRRRWRREQVGSDLSDDLLGHLAVDSRAVANFLEFFAGGEVHRTV
jgi:hypothetical protein